MLIYTKTHINLIHYVRYRCFYKYLHIYVCLEPNCVFYLKVGNVSSYMQPAFEAYWCGSWKPVECLRIRNGVVSMLIINEGETTEETLPMSDLRIRSRKANLADCTCFLRPGIDVCVLSTIPSTEEESSNENPKPVTCFLVKSKPYYSL